MMDFIYELYQNDNFVLYLTIALVILIVLFVLVLIFGKRDQKLEETKRLQKVDVDAFKEEKPTEDVKVEVKEDKKENIVEEKIEVKDEVKPEVTEEVKPVKSIFDDTQVLPITKPEENTESEEINVTTFEPIKVEESKEDVIKDKEEVKEENNVKPLLDIEEEDKPIKLDEINFDDLDLEKDLGELENIKNEFDNIKIPEVKEIKKEKVEEKVVERNETKPFKPSPQVFSSVFVNKEEPIIEENKEEIKTEEKVGEPPKTSLFSIQDDEDDIELPPLKIPKKKEEVKSPKFDDIAGETYNIK